MQKEKIKDLIQSVIDDLMEGRDLSTILLKCQTIAHYLDNKVFKEWLSNEQHGYEDLNILPNYRIIPSTITASIVSFNFREQKQIPQGAINSKYAHLYDFTVGAPLSEIERIANGDIKENILQPINACYYPVFQKIISGGIVQGLNKETPAFSFIGILNNFKSKLLDFLLEIETELDFSLEFTNEKNQKKIAQIMNQNIYAGIVHSGDGDINANCSTIVAGSQNVVSISNELKEDIESLLHQIDDINNRIDGDEADIAECIAEIQQELKAESPQPRFLKMSLKCLKAIPKITAESAISVAIERIIEQLL